MASSSSAQSNSHQILLPSSFTATPAPPPTPSNNHHLFPSSDIDGFSRLLQSHLCPPPTLLHLPSRFRIKNPTTSTNSPPPPPPSLPTIAFSSNLSESLSSSFLPAFFQLTHHQIPPHLPKSAELQSLSLFDPNSTHTASHLDTWPLGFDDDDDAQPSLRFDPASPSSSSPSLSSLRELAEALEKVGLDVVEALSHAVGFDSPMHEKGRACSLMWVSLSSSSRTEKGEEYEDGEGEAGLDPGRVYPYVVALEYQIRRRKYSLLSDSGWVFTETDVDSILVTVGDIAQVWSNGRLKKVRGRPLASSRKEEGSLSSSFSVSMCLLVTLPMESIVSPLLPLTESKLEEEEREEGSNEEEAGEKRISKFRSFSFEEYAWRVYHERFLFKDPLDRYRL